MVSLGLLLVERWLEDIAMSLGWGVVVHYIQTIVCSKHEWGAFPIHLVCNTCISYHTCVIHKVMNIVPVLIYTVKPLNKGTWNNSEPLQTKWNKATYPIVK